jgi:enoyl-CoA hydratase/carnithine racemase
VTDPAGGSVITERRGPATVITIRRPQVRNALAPEDARALAEAVETAGADRETLGIIVTGEGAFCAGGDLPAIMAMVEGATPRQVAERIYADFQRMARALRDCPVPTVAAVDGAAIGLGLDLALWCDTRFLGERAKLGQGWAALGLIPGTGGAALLERVAPGQLAPLLGARPLVASDAARIGLGTAVDNGLDAALALLDTWVGVGRPALEGYARLSRRGLPDDDYLRDCAAVQGGLLTSPAFAERANGILARH